MNEPAGEKSFAPTPSRIAKAKRDGNIARSQEVTAVAAACAGSVACAALAGTIGDASRSALMAAASGGIDGGRLAIVLACALATVALAGAGAACAGLAQSGGVRVVAISLKFERCNPVAGFKRMFSRESAIALVRAAVAFTCAVCAAAPAILAIFGAALESGDVRALAETAWGGIVRIVGVCIAAGALFAGLDYLLVRASWLRKLRMSFAELKREIKEHDGDPQARSRRRQLHRELSRGAIARTKDAAFVVVNPTHVAVALDYRPPDVPVPVVLVSAIDEQALRVREIAARHAIPVVENVALARELHAAARAGDPIAVQSYVAVAEIVAALTRAGALRA